MSVQLVKKALSDTLKKEKRNETKKKLKTLDIDKYLDTWMISFSDDESCDHKEIKTHNGSYNESRDKKSQQPHSQGQFDYYQKCKKLRSKVLKKMTRYMEEQKRVRKEDRCVSKEAIKASVERKRRKLLRLKEKRKQFNKTKCMETINKLATTTILKDACYSNHGDHTAGLELVPATAKPPKGQQISIP